MRVHGGVNGVVRGAARDNAKPHHDFTIASSQDRSIISMSMGYSKATASH